MPRNGQSVKEANREIRQETLRESLSAGGHLQYAVENIVKIEKLKSSKTSAFELSKYKIAAELRLRLVNKYLPDLKQTEITGEAGGAIQITEVTRTIING